MIINKTYKFKLRLTPSQEARVNSWIGACRVIYNLAKETKEYAYKSHRYNLGKFELMRQLTDLRKDVAWINDAPVGACQDVIERLDKAYQGFFKGGGYPKWAKKGQYKSITVKTIKQHTYNRFKLPKIGSVKYFANQEIKGELRRATIIKEADGYYLSVLTRQEVTQLAPSENQVGIDMGISYFLVTSDGEYVANPHFLSSTLPKLRREQRSLSRKVKGSNNWWKQVDKVARLHQKVKRQRHYFLHKLSSRLVKENHRIVVEDLNIKGMAKNKRIARYIYDVSWGEFFRQLEYKCKWYGKELIKVDPKYTSQECSECGHIARENRLSQSQFECVSCGHTANADLDAAKVILGRSTSNVRKRKAAA